MSQVSNDFRRHRAVLLAGSPLTREGDNFEDTTVWAAEEAIVSLARAAFANGVRLAYAGKAHVALLLASIATEYTSRQYAEEPSSPSDDSPNAGRYSRFVALVTQSSIEQQHLAPDLELMHKAGYLDLKRGERFIKSVNELIDEVSPEALVCVGGTFEELEPIIVATRQMRPHIPFYVMAMTGGRSAQLSEQGIEVQMNEQFIAYDRQVIDRLESVGVRESDETIESYFVQGVAPYPLIMQDLINTLSENQE